MQTVDPNIKPGIYAGIPNEAYHAGPGVSKSGLWTIHKKTPAHYKNPPVKEETTTTKGIKDFGTATHLAILEPNDFESKVVRGPEDRKGNKWSDLAEACRIDGKVLLTAGQYDEVLMIRDTVHADQWINAIITGGKPEVEASGYWIDPETGVLTRCRPDLYRADLGIMLDVKTSESAAPDDFARSVDNYGYHAQEAHYTDGYRELGRQVDGFVILTLEKKGPYATAVYELPPSIVDEGRAIIRKSMATYAECLKANKWPGYPSGVQELAFKRWAYRLTEAPEAEEAA